MMPDKGLVREIDILEKLYTKCYNESKGRSINPFRNGLKNSKLFIDSKYVSFQLENSKFI